MKKTFLLFLVMVSGAFGQGSRPPINKLGQLTDVQSGTPATGDVLRWNGTQWNRVKGTYVDLSGNLLPNNMPVNLPAGSTVGTVPIGTGGGGGITDSVKGDITVSGSGTIWSINDDVITSAKLATSLSNVINGKIDRVAAAVLGIDKEIWLSKRTDGQIGTGTAQDPYNAGSDLYAIWATIVAAAPNSVQFAPGTYSTSQTLHAISNCKFHGNGATIKTANTFWHTNGRNGSGQVAYRTILGSDDLSVPDANTGYHDIEVEGFIFDCNTAGQTTVGAAISAIQIVSSGNCYIHDNKFINWGSRSIDLGIEPFVIYLSATWNGHANYPSGFEVANNEFTQAGPNSLYTSLIYTSGFANDSTTAANLKNWTQGDRIHGNVFHDIRNVGAIFTVSGSTVTSVAHGLQANEGVYLTTTGSLPSGVTANTIYYARDITTNTFAVSATPGGTAITTSGGQSGTHTWTMTGAIHGCGTSWSVGASTDNNRFETCDQSFIAVYRDTGNTIDEAIVGNKVLNCYNAIWLTPAIFPSGVTNNQQGVRIENNTLSIAASSTSNGLALQLVDGSFGTGSVFTNPVIRGNRIRRHTASGTVFGFGVSNASGGVVQDNVADSVTTTTTANNTNVTFRDNIYPDGSPMLRAGGSLIPGNTITSTRGTIIYDLASTPKVAANFGTREGVASDGFRAWSWGGGYLVLDHAVAAGISDAQILLDASNLDDGDNQITLYTGGGDGSFTVNGNGELELFDHSTPTHSLIAGYHNFGGASVGSSGYGLHDNSGIMQFKNSGGGWNKINGVSSSAPTYGSTITPTYSGNYRTIANYTLTGNVTTINSPAGSPADGDLLELNILLSGGGWTITGWNAIYALSDNPPTLSTTSGKMFTMVFEYSTLKAKWLFRTYSDTY